MTGYQQGAYGADAGVDAVRACERRGGVARTRHLRGDGVRALDLVAALASGCLIRPRRGLYALPSLSVGAQHALAHREVLACVTAARHLGLWTLDAGLAEPLHVWADPARHSVRPRACGCVAHREHPILELSRPGGLGHRPADVAVHVSVVQCLVQIARCEGAEAFFCALESALHHSILSDRQKMLLRANLTAPHRWLIDFARDDADSGLESLIRLRLHKLGISCLTQVELPGVGRVDFIIGDRLIIEADGRTHEGAGLRRDYQRDAAAMALGFLTLRFDTAMIVHDWPRAEAAILRALALNVHISPLGESVRASSRPSAVGPKKPVSFGN